MIIRGAGETKTLPAGTHLAGTGIETIAFTQRDLRQLLLLGEKSLDVYFNEILLVRFILESDDTLMGMRAHLDAHVIDFTPGDRPMPDDVVELEIGRHSFEWLCGLDRSEGVGTLASVIREQLLPKMRKLD